MPVPLLGFALQGLSLRNSRCFLSEVLAFLPFLHQALHDAVCVNKARILELRGRLSRHTAHRRCFMPRLQGFTHLRSPLPSTDGLDRMGSDALLGFFHSRVFTQPRDASGFGQSAPPTNFPNQVFTLTWSRVPRSITRVVGEHSLSRLLSPHVFLRLFDFPRVALEPLPWIIVSPRPSIHVTAIQQGRFGQATLQLPEQIGRAHV